MGIYKKKTFFSEYAPNPFEANKNSEMYQTIFKDNIEEKTNDLITVEKTNILMQNELIYEKELKEKYNPELLFKKKECKIEEEKEPVKNNKEEVSLIEYKENIFTRLIKKRKNNF